MYNGCQKIMKIRNGFRLPEIKTENRIQNFHKFSNESNCFENFKQLDFLSRNCKTYISSLFKYYVITVS